MASILNAITFLVPSPLAHLLTRLLLLGLVVSLVAPLLYAPLGLVPGWSQRIPARLRFRVLAASFALLLAAPLAALLPALLHLSAPGFALPAAPISAAFTSAAFRPARQPIPAWHILPAFAVLVALLWLIASAWLALRLLREFLRVRQLRQSAQPLEATVVPHPLCPVAVSGQVSSPCLTGLLAPMVLLPATLPSQLSSPQLAAILEHEFAHLRRRDPWTNLLQKLALVIFPLHPGLHLLDRWMSREREHACDEWVLLRAHAAREYATSLVDVASGAIHAAAIAVPLAAVGSRSELSSRIERIVRPVPALPRRVAATLAILLTVGSTSLAAFVLHLMPTISFASARAASRQTQQAQESMPADRASAAVAPSAPRMIPTAFDASAHASARRSVLLPAQRQPRAAMPLAAQPLTTPPFASRRSFSPVRAMNTAWQQPSMPSQAIPIQTMPGQTMPSQAIPDAAQHTRQTQPLHTATFALIIETTTITESTVAAETTTLHSDEAWVPAPTMATPAATQAATPEATPAAYASRQIVYSIVTTTLRLTPAEHLRLEQAWRARKL